jgi:hypothetical protein
MVITWRRPLTKAETCRDDHREHTIKLIYGLLLTRVFALWFDNLRHCSTLPHMPMAGAPGRQASAACMQPKSVFYSFAERYIMFIALTGLKFSCIYNLLRLPALPEDRCFPYEWPWMSYEIDCSSVDQCWSVILSVRDRTCMRFVRIAFNYIL